MDALPRFAVAHVYVVIFFTGDDTDGMRRAVSDERTLSPPLPSGLPSAACPPLFPVCPVSLNKIKLARSRRARPLPAIRPSARPLAPRSHFRRRLFCRNVVRRRVLKTIRPPFASASQTLFQDTRKTTRNPTSPPHRGKGERAGGGPVAKRASAAAWARRGRTGKERESNGENRALASAPVRGAAAFPGRVKI